MEIDNFFYLMVVLSYEYWTIAAYLRALEFATLGALHLTLAGVWAAGR